MYTTGASGYVKAWQSEESWLAGQEYLETKWISFGNSNGQRRDEITGAWVAANPWGQPGTKYSALTGTKGAFYRTVLNEQLLAGDQRAQRLKGSKHGSMQVRNEAPPAPPCILQSLPVSQRLPRRNESERSFEPMAPSM